MDFVSKRDQIVQGDIDQSQSISLEFMSEFMSSSLIRFARFNGGCDLETENSPLGSFHPWLRKNSTP